MLASAIQTLGEEPGGCLDPVDLRCEYAVNPLGVDVAQPRLSWRVEGRDRGERQTAYRLLVSSTADELARDRGDLWDSGKVSSDETLFIPYAGKPLESSQQVFWKVRVWDAAGDVSAWSTPATWTMGVLKPEDWRGQWIVAPWSTESLLVRREFDVKPGLRRALVHVCGLGQFELSVNGRKVGNNILSPGWSKYDRTCLYETHDITPLVMGGGNAVGLTLGDGMYHTERRNRFTKFIGSFGPKRACGQIELEYEDGSREYVGTDESWRVHPGPVTYNDIYGGEDYDARLEQHGWDAPGFDDAGWANAVLLVRPEGELRGLTVSAPPLQEIETIEPVAVNRLSETCEVVDLGQNASYMPRITVSGPVGSTVRLTHAEIVNPDGTISRTTCGGNRGPAWWQYTKATDEPETWFPQFFYAGCRYLQVDKIPAKAGGELPRLDKIEGVVVHSTAEPVGQFDCSNELLNRIRTLVRWAQRSNMASILTDCPHREKLGWLEQSHLNGPSIRYEFDVDRIYIKTMHDMADSQTHDGLVPTTAPEFASFNGPPRIAVEWGSAFIIDPWQHYQFTGDESLLREYYPRMQRYMRYLATRAKGHILEDGLGDWYDVGPEPPYSHAQLTPPAVTCTALYYLDARLMSRTAELLGRPDDARRYAQLADEIRQAWLREFRHPEMGTYATQSQCSNAMALALGLAEPEDRDRTLSALVKDVRGRGNALSTGAVGFGFLLRALAQGGQSDVVYDMLNQDEKPGYAYQLKQGATTLAESWDASRGASQNHYFLGQIVEWFYTDLVGINPDPTGPGFKRIIIRPTPVGDLQWAEASYRSIRGPISVRWDRVDGRFRLHVTIPANTTATVYVPAKRESEVTEGDAAAADSPGVRLLRREGERAVYAIDSGTYTFESRP